MRIGKTANLISLKQAAHLTPLPAKTVRMFKPSFLRLLHFFAGLNALAV